MHLNPVLAAIGSYPMAVLQEKARTMRAAGVDLLDFSLGDPREPTPEFIRQALIGAVPEVSQYPTTPGLPETRQAVADYVRRRFGVETDPDTQILITAGSKEAIFSSHFAFVDRSAHDAVIWATPAYPVYERGALLAGARPAPVRLGGDFVLTPDLIPDDDWDAAAMLWINYPHNPTGAVIDQDGLAALYERSRASGTLLCSDECYTDVYDGEPAPSILQVADDGVAGALSFLSLSKRSGMTGYRSAAIVGDAEAIAALRKLRSSTGTASQEFVQAAAIAAWSDDRHVAQRRRIFAEKRAILRTAFTPDAVVASRGGLYLWVRVGDDVAVAERLLGCGIIVSPGSVFGPGGEGFIRMALVPTLDECARAAEVVHTCLTES